MVRIERKMFLCIDESGNTQSQIALGMATIPESAVETINQLFTLRETDPPEIQKLYYRRPKPNKRPREEFKYSDFISAYKATELEVYKNFLQNKLKEIAKLPITTYFTIFDKPETDQYRIHRIKIEAQILIETWAADNQKEALSKGLAIIVDQQVFDGQYLFQIYEVRNRIIIEIFNKNRVAGTKHWEGKENITDIQQRNSKTFKPLQLTDFLVGAYREAQYYKDTENFDIIKRLNKHNRDARGEYKLPKTVRLV